MPSFGIVTVMASYYSSFHPEDILQARQEKSVVIRY